MDEKTIPGELKELFRIFDKDNDGFITINELRTAMRCLGYETKIEELQELIKEFDKDENGNLDINEFVELVNKKIEEAEKEKELIDTFNIFDREGNGFLEKKDMMNIFNFLQQEIDEKLLDDFFGQIEGGKINAEQFVKLLK
jgi:calmodulin